MPSIREQGIWAHDANNFDIMRLLLATLVIYSHAFPIFLGTHDWWQGAGSHYNLGQLAVMAFFIISGMLVTRSATFSRSGFSYAISRIYRLVPGAFVCALWCALILGAIMTSLALHEYYSSGRVWSFIFRNTYMMAIQYDLPGVFSDNIYKQAVNGSLWSLKVEIKMYIAFGLIVFVARQFKFLSAHLNYIMLAVTILALVRLYVPDLPWDLAEDPKAHRRWDYGYYFAAGALLYTGEKWFPRSLPLAMALSCGTVLLLIMGYTELYHLALRLSLPYLIFCLAFADAKSVRKLQFFPDISYGVYIYAFPVQQAVSALFAENKGFATLTFLSILITYVLAYMSWKFVEEPALMKKSRHAKIVSDWFSHLFKSNIKPLGRK